MGDKTKIDWCDASWNPVTGCWHDCPYCYARGIAKRFGAHLYDQWKNGNHVLDQPIRTSETYEYMRMAGVKEGPIVPYPYDFEPTFHRYRLDIPAKWTKPRTIFVCSMADLFGNWVPDEWIVDVFAACKAAPQHRYLFLTKNPKRYTELYDNDILPEGDNFWFGSSIPKETDNYWYSGMYHNFVSIEPILGPFTEDGEGGKFTNWVIVGAETGNRKNKVIPEKKWIDNIVMHCDRNKQPIFLKDSLREIMGRDFRQEYPWDSATDK